jgi:hypothetical protein
MRTAFGLIGLALLLGLAGCQGSDQASTVEDTTTAPRVATSTVTATPGEPPLSPEEKLLDWIQGCDVRMILFTHENVAWVKFEGGGLVRLRLDDDAEARVSDAAFTQECEKRIIVGIE